MTSQPIVKICGLSESDGLNAALSAGADMVGFVFFPASPRHIGAAKARELGVQVAGRARKVALTVDATDDLLAEIVGALDPDLLQLHGRETPARAAAVRARFGLPVLKAIGVSDIRDVAGASAYAGVAEAILFDAKASPGALRPGGNGLAFDWRLLAAAKSVAPFFLSGGLSCETVAEALASTGASGVDVSSGVESSPGVKDPEMIARFVAAARRAVLA